VTPIATAKAARFFAFNLSVDVCRRNASSYACRLFSMTLAQSPHCEGGIPFDPHRTIRQLPLHRLIADGLDCIFERSVQGKTIRDFHIKKTANNPALTQKTNILLLPQNQ